MELRILVSLASVLFKFFTRTQQQQPTNHVCLQTKQETSSTFCRNPSIMTAQQYVLPKELRYRTQDLHSQSLRFKCYLPVLRKEILRQDVCPIQMSAISVTNSSELWRTSCQWGNINLIVERQRFVRCNRIVCCPREQNSFRVRQNQVSFGNF